MVSPLKDYGIKGFLRYQGESDRETTNYQELFSELITSWRMQWQNMDLPFYFVQIAPFSYEELNPIEGGNASRIRAAQQETLLSIPRTGMVVSMDAGDCNDIHPSNKKVIGDRLAFWALAETYGIPIPHKSPIFKQVLMESRGEVNVIFDNAENGFIRKEPIQGFYLSKSSKYSNRQKLK